MVLAIDGHTLELTHWAGKEQYLFEMIKGMAENSRENIIVYGRQDISFLAKRLPANLLFVFRNLPTPIWQFWLLWDMKRRGISHFFVPCTYLAAALNFFIPQTVVIHDLTSILPQVNNTHTRSLRFKERMTLALALRHSRNIVSVSDNTKKDLTRVFPNQAHKISVVYPGARLKAIREAEVLWDKEPLLLAVGTIEPRKNTLAVLSTFEQLKQQVPSVSWKLAIVGKIGWKAEPILAAIAASPYSSDIKLTGYVTDEELQKYYHRALCLIYPSLYEGFGSPPLEAMSQGCPVIVAGNSSLPEVVGEAGLFGNNSEEIVDIVRRLYYEKDWRDGHIKQGLVRAPQFNWSEGARRVLALVSRISDGV